MYVLYVMFFPNISKIDMNFVLAYITLQKIF